MRWLSTVATAVAEGVDVPAILNVSTPFATAIGMVYLIFSGRLYVRSAHDDMIRVLEASNVAAAVAAAAALAAMTTERDTYRDASLSKDATIRLLAETVSKFEESAKFQHHVMAALQESTGRASA